MCAATAACSSTDAIWTLGLKWGKSMARMFGMAIHKRGSGSVYLRGNIWWIQYFVAGSRLPESRGASPQEDPENIPNQPIAARAPSPPLAPPLTPPHNHPTHP